MKSLTNSKSDKKGYMLLTEEQYDLVRNTVEQNKGFGPLHRVFLDRIVEPEETTIEEKKKSSGK
jgi:hypothetical protein